MGARCAGLAWSPSWPRRACLSSSSETNTVEGGVPVGMAVPGTVGPYGMIARRYASSVTAPAPGQQLAPGTLAPPLLGGRRAGPGRRAGSSRAHRATGLVGDVWLPRAISSTANSTARTPSPGCSTGASPAPVSISAARSHTTQAARPEQVAAHADHYVHLVEEQLRDYHERTGGFGSITASYDTELFGHWWFEGVDWLKAVLRGLASRPAVELTTASRIVEEHPPREVLSLPESSWGAGGGHFTWLNDDTTWMWPLIHAAERQMEELVTRYPDADGPRRDVLNQAARELLLLQSSDWPFLVTTLQAKEYAVERFEEHLARFDQLRVSGGRGGFHRRGSRLSRFAPGTRQSVPGDRLPGLGAAPGLRGRAAGRLPCLRLQLGNQPAQRDFDPVRAVARLVGDLVERLVELPGRQCTPEGRVIVRHERQRARRDGFAVSLQERSAGAPLPARQSHSRR